MIEAFVLAAALSFAQQGSGNTGQSGADPAQQAEAQAAPVLALGAPQSPAESEDNPLAETASTYALYHSEVNTAGQRELRSGLDLDETMDALAAYYADDRLVDAQIAYAALVAAQNPEFIDSVRAISDYYGSDVAMQALMEDPLYVTGFMGADAAMQSVTSAVGEDVGRMDEVGMRYRQAAYNLQTEAWAQRRARDRQERLAAIETASSRLTTNFRLAEEIGPASRAPTAERLGSAASLFEGEVASDTTGPITLSELELTVGERQLEPDERRVGQILVVAALQSIEDGDMAYLDQLLSNPAVERCIMWAKLDLQQCVAAGHFKYEDAFCIAEHALDDVADCLTTARIVSN